VNVVVTCASRGLGRAIAHAVARLAATAGTPDVVVAAVRFLRSDAAGAITGADLDVCAGTVTHG
jgi:NAD(P)-dependent dehydrogenase (short-subunit alcohol dehydrogenase family)